jgi:hypothetical protein
MKAISNITLLSLLLTFQFIPAQAPDTLWTKTFGSSGHNRGYSVQQTVDGGYIITGFTSGGPPRHGELCLIKTDASGDSMWIKKFWPTYGISVQQTFDDGFIIAGQIHIYNDESYLIKTDANGDTMWSKKFDGSTFNSVRQTSDSGYVVAGSKNGDLFLLKTNGSGDTLWTKIYGGNGHGSGSSVQQTLDEGYIVTGTTHSYGAYSWDVWLLKTDESGDTLWTKTFGGDLDDGGNSVQQTLDGGYIITGFKDHDSWVGDLWLIKTDDSGDTLWTKTFGDSLDDCGYSVKQTSDSGYVITGVKDYFDINFPLKIRHHLINRYSDLGVKDYSAGDSGDLWLIKTNDSGNTLWTKTLGDTFRDCGYSVQQTSDGGYVISGTKGSYSESADIWLIKIASDPTNVGYKNPSNLSNDFKLKQNYPNPFNPSTAIEFVLPKTSEVTLKIYNTLGEEVATLLSAFLPAGSYQYEWDASDYASGVYLYRLETQGFVQTRKMILMK